MQPTIFVVDDDPAVSRALTSVGQLLGLPVASFGSSVEFLETCDASRPGCVVLDLEMPEISGLELQQRLAEAGVDLPIIMVSGHADVRLAVEAMSRGAVTVLEKPVPLEELIGHTRRALQLDARKRQAHALQRGTEARLAQLTSKEREVFDLVVAGNTNKQIAAQLHLSIRAVEDRRGRLMKKLGVRSLAELLPRRSLRA